MQELIKKLQEMVDAGSKKADLEESIGLPKNSLSAVLNGKVDMPKKWIPKLEAFFTKPIAETNGEVSAPKMVVKSNGKLSLAPSPETIEKMNLAIEKINKDFGAGSVMRLGDEPMKGVEVISTGCLSLNVALGIGGLPRGRIVEIYGPEGSGKTTIATYCIAEAQKMGGRCAFIDAEHAFDADYAKTIGVNTDELYLSQPDFGEQALEEADRLILSGGYAIVVIDSVAALVPKAELEGEMGDSKMALQARLMSQACRKLVGTVSKTNTLLIFINQLRAVINQGYGNWNGPTEITTGGNALKFYASVRLDVRKSATIKDGEEVIGNKVRVKIVKSKVAPPFKIATFDILYGYGIDNIGEILDAACEKNIIQKSGSWFSYNGDKLGQGREGVRQLLKDNPNLLSEIQNKLTTKRPE